MKIKFVWYLRVRLNSLDPTADVIYYSTLRFILTKLRNTPYILECSGKHDWYSYIIKPIYQIRRIKNWFLIKIPSWKIFPGSILFQFSTKFLNLRQKPAESLPYLVRCYIFCGDLRYSKYKYVYNLYFLHLKSLFLVSHVAFQAWWTCLFNKNEIQTMGELFYFV